MNPALLGALLCGALLAGLTAGWVAATGAYVRRARRWHAARLANPRAGDHDHPDIRIVRITRPFDWEADR